MAKRDKAPARRSKSEAVEALAQRALDVAKKARKHRKSLTSENFYANKLVELRADATNTFRELAGHSVGDVSAMAEMIQEVFSAKTPYKRRTEAAKELTFSLRTTWRETTSEHAGEEGEGLFPLSLLADTGRGYLVAIGRQMNGCFASGWYDACAVMMRRLLEVSIVEAFEKKGLSDRIKRPDGNYVDLSELVRRALTESTWALSRNTRKWLPELKDVGHVSAHGRYYTATRADIQRIRQGCRVVIEEFLRHAELL
jgi:hypothetical protein